MAEFVYVIDSAHSGMTVKDYTRKTLGISARGLISLKKNPEGIKVNGIHEKSIAILNVGDVLSLNTAVEDREYEPLNMEIDVAFEDENYLAVNKPWGMTVYKAGSGDVTLLGAVAEYYRKKDAGFIFRPLYRLDRDTSGIVVMAGNNLVPQLTELKKEYFAVCHGVTEPFGRIDSPIGLSSGSKILRTTGQGKPAATNYERIATDGSVSLIKLELETGRTHQIRVHMASIGHPLCGDDLYGGSREKINRQALHCKNVRIISPTLGVDRLIETNFPEDFEAAFPELFAESIAAPYKRRVE